MLHELWLNFSHNLFTPLLLFFYLGFLIPVLGVKFEFPYVIYQGLTLYLLLAIGWRGGEELAGIDASSVGPVAGLIALGFATNLTNGLLAYVLLTRMTSLRKIDRATVAGYYGSDSAGTFAACVGVLVTIGMAYDAFMPVLLAVMETPGPLIALFLVGRLRRRGVDADGNALGEPGYNAGEPGLPQQLTELETGGELVAALAAERNRAIAAERELALEQPRHPVDPAEPAETAQPTRTDASAADGAILREMLLNPGLYLLFGGMLIGFISALQGHDVTRSGDVVFVNAFQGILCLFLMEMGMTAARKLRDLRTAGRGFIAFGLLAPNLFAGIGITVVHGYAHLTGTVLQPGTYVLFAVLCAAASYIAVPAVQRLAIPEASPTLPLAAALGLTFTYNVTIGIPLYIQAAGAVTGSWPVG